MSERTRKPRVKVPAAPAAMHGGLLQRASGRGGGLAGSDRRTGLSVNTPGDRYEREADRVADAVMSMRGGGMHPRGRGVGGAVARMAATNAGARASSGGEAPAIVHDVLRSGGQPLDAGTRGLMESRFGHDFTQVRVHSDARAAESASAVNARAYTVGNDVVFGASEYARGTSAGQRLLAHELTHVLQQNAGAGGQLQREEKPKAQISGERSGKSDKDDAGKDSVKDNFGFKAEVTVPLTGDLKFGAISFLDELKLTGSGGATGQPLLGSTPAKFDDLKLQLALTLAKLELESVKSKADALKKGKLSFGTTLSTSGGPTFSFDPNKSSGSIGAELEAKAGATTPSLIPSPYGKLTLGTSLSATGSVTEKSGTPNVFTPKAEGKAGVTGSFESADSSKPARTLGGVLGDKARVTAGFDAGVSGSISPDKTSGAVNLGGSLGLVGTSKGGAERFIKLQLTGDIGLDHKTGSATTSTKSMFLGLSTGFTF